MQRSTNHGQNQQVIHHTTLFKSPWKNSFFLFLKKNYRHPVSSKAKSPWKTKNNLLTSVFHLGSPRVPRFGIPMSSVCQSSDWKAHRLLGPKRDLLGCGLQNPAKVCKNLHKTLQNGANLYNTMQNCNLSWWMHQLSRTCYMFCCRLSTFKMISTPKS